MKKAGFIGLGIMGKPMAINLVKAGIPLMVLDLNKEAVRELVDLGAVAANSPKDIGENCDVIFTILPNGKIVENVVLGTNGIVEGIKSGTVIIDMSSVSPVETEVLNKKLIEIECFILDAPVSGGEPKAITGELAFMVGGEQEAFDKVVPYFDIMGSSALLVGKSGCGSTVKLANQIIVNLNIAAMSEGLVLAAKAGVDPEKLFHAIKGGLAGSAVLNAKVPLIVERNFVAGGRIDINMKDMTNVMATAHALDVPLPLSSNLLEIMHALNADGKGTDDHGGIVQYFEKLAGVEVKRV
jgi:2-hydroxy-3-oxopropionate reductase